MAVVDLQRDGEAHGEDPAIVGQVAVVRRQSGNGHKKGDSSGDS